MSFNTQGKPSEHLLTRRSQSDCHRQCARCTFESAQFSSPVSLRVSLRHRTAQSPRLQSIAILISLYIMFFTRLTSWESACKIIAQHGKISPLHPFHPSLALSLFLLSLRNKYKTKFFPIHLKTILEEVLSELKYRIFTNMFRK